MAAKSPRRARPQRARARLARIPAGAPLVAASLLAAGALAGCGGAAATATSSAVERKPQLALTSPALTAQGLLPALYTCTGKNIPPPFQWGAVPAGTAELALFLLNLGHTQSAGAGGALEAKLTVGWSVRSISPKLHGFAAGRLPAGAVTGRGRYSVCPPKGGTGEYMFRLYALPKRVAVPSSASDIELFRQINRSSSAGGDFVTNYTRG
jgi:phosphatidylethanolamine-binding protein (PEBP) family uncharacterized protein